MGMRNVTVDSQHGIERIMIRATSAQKHLVHELREGKDKSIREESGQYALVSNEKRLRYLNKDTVEKLLDMKVLEYTHPQSSKITLSLAAK